MRRNSSQRGILAKSGLRRWVRRVIGGTLLIGVGIAAGHLSYYVSVEPGAAIVKASFEAKPLVVPPDDFGERADLVAAVRRVRLDDSKLPLAYLDIYKPSAPSSAALPMILWVHGGGFISSSSTTIADYAILLASHGYIVASLDYSIAPGSKHPIPVLQAVDGLNFLRQNAAGLGGDAERIVIGGDSAGAQIASETAAAETNPILGKAVGVSTPTSELKGVALFCGLYDMRSVASTGFPALRTYLWAYTGNRDWTSYRNIDQLSTTEQITSDYPATFISVGNIDPFEPQAKELATAVRANDVPLETLYWDSSAAALGHEYQFDFALPQARTAFEATLSFLARATI